MYRDFMGREIEDAEMDAMREDARESASETSHPVHPILAILKEAQDELEAQGERYDAMNWRTAHQAIKERKYYALDAQMSLLASIMEKIAQVPHDTERAVRVTAEMLHDAYKYVEPDGPDWLHISLEMEHKFYLMAEHLNRAIDLKVVGQEPGYVWSNEEA